MGLVHVEVELANARRDDLAIMKVLALADSGALHLCIPQHVAMQLDLSTLDHREVTIADGKRISVPYAGPVRVRFQNRQCLVGALVIGDEVLLGAIPMEDRDILVDPARRQVVVNPENPNIPASVAKSLPPETHD